MATSSQSTLTELRQRLDFVGVDPGMKGYISHLPPCSDQVNLYPMPVRPGRIDVAELIMWVRRTFGLGAKVFIEAQFSNKTGYQKVFSNFGRVVSAFERWEMPWTEIRPNSWKAFYGLTRKPKVASKVAAEVVAERLGLSVDFGRRRVDAHESFLIMCYGMETKC